MKTFGTIEENYRSLAATKQLVNDNREYTTEEGEVLEVIINHGSEFYDDHRNQEENADHFFEK